MDSTLVAPAPTQQPPIGSPPTTNGTIMNGQALMNGSTDIVTPTPAGPSNATFSLAPGDGRNQAHPATAAASSTVLDYKTDFPELMTSGDGQLNTFKEPNNAWSSKLPKLRSSDVTQVFYLPANERSLFRSSGAQFGDSKSQEQEKCRAIAEQTGTQIELCESSKDNTLTIVLSGKRALVEEARKRVVQMLQMQATHEIRVPKEHHRVIIGKEGKRLRELEAETDCRIQMPGREKNTDIIKVTGPKEGIDRALHKIQQISDEQSKLAQEHLMIPRIYYPWVRGPYNKVVDKIMADTGARVNIPPPSAQSEIITVTGEKEGVYSAANTIRQIHEEKSGTCKTITCDFPKSQHRFIIGREGSGLADILEQTGVSVEVPPEQDNSETILLRGDPEKLAVALPLVYQKASSVITVQLECPVWLHRFIIGQGGSNIRALVGDPPKCSVDLESSGQIFIEGSPEEVRPVEAKLRTLVNQLVADMHFEVVKVKVEHHRHIIGRGGSVIAKIKEEHGVQITIPDEKLRSEEIRVEGNKAGVTAAANEIKAIANRLENEKTREIIIEQRFHGQIIGQGGAGARELRDKFPGIQVSFPEQGRKSDVVQLRGHKDIVDKCYKHLQTMTKELKEQNFQVRVPIFKDFHRHIIGKGGRTISKIRDDTDCRIDMPSEESGDDAITITGKKDAVEKAVTELKRIQDELAKVTSVEIKIAQKLHSRMRGGGERLIQDISEQCGGVHIHFPDSKTTSDIVTIRGPTDDVEKAQKLLQQLAKDRELSSHEDTIKFNPQFRRFLIGRNGQNIKKIRDICPDVRIIVPRDQDQDQDTITLMGRKEEVDKIKVALEKHISELNETVEVITDVDSKWHKHFVQRGAAVLHELQDACGGVMVSFPRQGTNDTKVSIKGSKECCDEASRRIAEIVSDLENTTTQSIEIAQEHHRKLLANRAYHVNEIQSKYKVQISFPSRRAPDGTEAPEPEDANEVKITGTPDNIEAAKTDLLALVPIVLKVDVPFDMHRSLIGKGGSEIRNFQQQFDVNMAVPNADEKADFVTLTGAPKMVESAKRYLESKIEEYNEQAKDRELRSFELKVPIGAQYHQRIIGQRGANINKLRDEFKVNIRIPRGDDPEPETIVIQGYEADTEKCRDHLLSMINDLESLFRQEITLDARIHSRLIGQRGRTLKKIMDDYHVEITFPRSSDPNPNLVVVSGKEEDLVYDCIDYLRNMEEEYMQDITERAQYQAPSKQQHYKHNDENKAIAFTNAPWQSKAPELTSPDDFPTMGNGASAVNGGAPAPGAWGRRH